MGYPIALAIGGQVLRPVAAQAFRAAATRIPVLTRFPQIPAPPSGLPSALVAVWAGSQIYAALKDFFLSGASGWTIHCNTGPERDPMGLPGIGTCETVGFLSSPAMRHITGGPNETFTVNYGRDLGAGLPGFGVRKYSASLTRPNVGEAPPMAPGSPLWIERGRGSALNPTTGRARGYYGAVVDPWFPPVGVPFDRPMPWALAPHAQALAGERAEGPTRGNSIPVGVPATGAVSPARIDRAYWQEAIDSWSWPRGAVPAVPVAPVAPINPAFPPIETPFPGLPVERNRYVNAYGLDIVQPRSGALPQRPPTSKEKKIKSNTLAGLLRLSAIVWNHADDWKDYVEALHKALPKECQKPAGGTSRARAPAANTYGRVESGGVSYGRGNRRRRPATGRSVDTRTRVKPTPQQQVQDIAGCFGKIDVNKAVAGLAKEVMEDILGAAAAHARDASAKKAAALGGKPIFNTGREVRAPGLSF